MGNSYEGKRQSKESGDTLQHRERAMHMIAHALGEHARVVDKPNGADEQVRANHAISKGGTIGEPYMLKLAAAKNPGQSIKDVDDLIKLPTSRLEQLFFTLRNRIAAREGRGERQNRNKKQRGDD